MKKWKIQDRRFFRRSLLTLAALICISMVGVYIAGTTAYQNSNQLGMMTADYLRTQEEQFVDSYGYLLEHAAYDVQEMIARGKSAGEIEAWVRQLAQDYQDTLIYSQSGIYGLVQGETIFSSGWNPGADYDVYSRPWYQLALQTPGQVACSWVYPDARDGVEMVSLSVLLPDGVSVLATDVRVGDVEIQWQEGGDTFPGTATVLDGQGNVILHQQITREHVSCPMDNFTQEDYQALMAEMSGERGLARLTLEGEEYQFYYVTDQHGWLCVVSIPTGEITAGATTLFIILMAIIGAFLAVIVYMWVYNYRSAHRAQRTIRSFQRLGQTYYTVVLVDAQRGTCEVMKTIRDLLKGWRQGDSYEAFCRLLRPALSQETWEEFERSFSLENLGRVARGELDRCYLEYLSQPPGEEGRWVSAEAISSGESREEEVILAFRTIHEDKVAELERSRLLRESLEIARTAGQAKSDFLSRMSHDMRTPMNAVIGFAQVARNNLDDPRRVEESLDKITVASQQLLHLINEILDMAKIEQGRMELQLAPLELGTHVEQLAELFRVQAEAQGKALTVDTASLAGLRIATDSHRLDQILNNLLSNAVKYTPAGGSITLTADQSPSDRQDMVLCRFVVADTGIGMSPEFLQRIFLPFEREDNSMTGTVSGVGLGMAIVKNIVQLMGGTIDVESESGRGSRFTVVLPCALCPGEVEAAPQESGEPEADLTGRRFLLAEDNELNMEIATELLGMEGAEVVQVWNGREAVDRFEKEPPGTFDAILMDIQMPVLDGHGAARAIRALDRPDAATIPIVAMTANAFADDVIAAREAGMTGYIAKPIDMKVVRTVLAQALEKNTQA